MTNARGPIVTLVARTEFLAPAGVPFDTDVDGGQALVEFAGRSCYQAWDRSVPATATNRGYIEHLLQVGHLAALEHSTATFQVAGISRGVGDELARHRHLSCSQLSQRFDPDLVGVVEPPAIASDPELHELFDEAIHHAHRGYDRLLKALQDKASDAPEGALLRKQARQLARAVLPAAGATSMVISGNYRAWRHFVGVRATDAADTEMRAVAVAILGELQVLAPNVFADFRMSTLPDGSQTAASPLIGEG